MENLCIWCVSDLYNVEKYRLKGKAAKLYLNGVKLSVAKETSFTAIKDLTANEK